MGFFKAAVRRSKRGYRGKLHRCNGGMEQARVLSRDFETQLPDDVRIIHEGSGVDVKYYAQLGADTASKKLLGNPLGEDYDIIHFGWMVYRLHGYNYQYVFSDSAVFSVDTDKDKAHCRLIAKQTVMLHVEIWSGGPHQGAEHSVGDFKFRLTAAGFYRTDSITLTPEQIIDINLAWGDSHTAAQVMVIRDR